MQNSNNSQDIEYVQFQVEQRVVIYKLPSLSTSKGYYLDEWKEMMWEGGVKVTDKNNQQIIYFISPDGSIFASCIVSQNYQDSVQRTLDSARGFGIRLQNPNGGYMWIGVVFRDNTAAFDFKVCIQEYQDKKQRELNPEKFVKEFDVKQNFSLNQGEKIVFTSSGAKPVQQNNQKNEQKVDLKQYKFGAPKGSNTNTNNNNNQQQINTQFNQQKTNSNSAANFGDFGNFNQPQVQQQQKQNQFDFDWGVTNTQQQNNQAINNNNQSKQQVDLFGDFNYDFTNNQNQQLNKPQQNLNQSQNQNQNVDLLDLM